jgi:hypothetical protein
MARFTKIPLGAVRRDSKTPEQFAPAQRPHAAMPAAFAQAYPHLSRWVQGYGWIEVGQDHYSRSLVRVLDEGGMIWESATRYTSLDEALREAEEAVAQWMREQLGER